MTRCGHSALGLRLLGVLDPEDTESRPPEALCLGREPQLCPSVVEQP